MPVAPINMVEMVLKYAVSVIPSTKILMGVPNYGYDFRVPKLEDVPARLLTNPGAVKLAREKNAAINYNSKAQSPFFTYYQEGIKREVHFEDARSIQAKIQLAINYDLAGLSVWTLMSYFPAMWFLINYYADVVKVIK